MTARPGGLAAAGRRPAAAAPSPSRGGWSAALAAVLLLMAPPAAAQESLQVLADSVAAAWQRGDVEALAAWMPEDGIELHLPDEAHPRLPLRQVRAALARLVEDRSPGRAVLGRVEAQQGLPPAGFAELHWTPADPESWDGHIAFVGMREMEGRWRVYQIRILPEGQLNPNP